MLSPECGSGQRDVARSIDAGRAGLEKAVDGNSAIELEAGLFGQSQAGPHADPDDHQIGLDRAAAFERGALAVDRRCGVLEMKNHAVLFMQPADEIAELRPEDALHRPGFRSHDMNLDVARAQRRRDLKPDEARTDNKRATRALRVVDDGAAVRERTQRVHMGLVGAGYRKPHRLRTGRQQQPVVGDVFASADDEFAGLRIDAGDFHVEAQFDSVRGIEVVRPQRQPILRRRAGEIVLGQIGPVDGRRGIAAEHDQGAAEAAPPQHLRGREARRPASDDDDPSRRVRRHLRPPRRLHALFLDKNPPVALLDLPAINRAESWGAQRLSAAQIEAGVVPRAPHAVADDKAVAERPVVVGAMGADRKQLRAAAHQQHLLVADVSDKLAVDEIGKGYALRQIGTARGCLFLCHLASSRSDSHAEKFLTQFGMIAQAADHAAGDKVRLGLVDAAGGHAVVRRLTRTPTPRGFSTCSITLAICAVSRSWSCRRLA